MRPILPAALIAACLAVPLHAQSTDSAERSETVTLSGLIEAIDPETREVSIAGDNGNRAVFEAGEEVANFDQLEVGDRVTLEYTEAVALSMANPGDEDTAEVVVADARAQLGEKPGAAMAAMVSFVVELVSYDAETQMATVIFPDGGEHQLPVHEKMLDFAASKQPGDQILVAIGQSAAVVVTPED